MRHARAPEWAVFRAAAVACVAVVPALLVIDLTALVEQQTKRAVVDGSFVVFSTLAAIACLRAGNRRRSAKLPWLALGGAAACYAVGNAVWFYYQVLAPETQTFPGPADIFYVLGVPFAIAAML